MKFQTEEEFVRDFDPQQKPNGDYLELEDVKNLHWSNVWTVVEGLDGDLYALKGFHRINVYGFVTSDVPWTPSTKDAVWCEIPEEMK